MKQEYLSWKNLLNELNDFNCKIEFLQIKIRKNLILNKNFNITEYVSKLRGLLDQHSKNLSSIEANNSNFVNLSGNTEQLKFPSTGIDKGFIIKKEKIISADYQ